MDVAREQGIGFEAASYGELTQALRTGVDPHMVVFDSPCKSRKELQFALEQGVHMNIDNWQVCVRVCEVYLVCALYR